MSSKLGTKKKPVSSTGWGDHGSHREPTINAGQHPSDDKHSQSMRKPPPAQPPPDQQRRDKGYNQTYDTKTQGQRRPSATSREDGTNGLPAADRGRNDDHGQRGANVDNGQKPVSSQFALRFLQQFLGADLFEVFLASHFEENFRGSR